MMELFSINILLHSISKISAAGNVREQHWQELLFWSRNCFCWTSIIAKKWTFFWGGNENDAGKLYETLKTEFLKILADENLLTEKIEIISKALTPEEAIGITKRKDFPIITGKEIVVQAEYRGAKGQAFTNSPSVFKGTLAEICGMDLKNDPQAAGLFIASLNAVMKYLGKSNSTVHCKSEGPEKCEKDVLSYIKEEYGNPKIALVGYQPSMLENLSGGFSLRVLDLNPANIGAVRYGVKVEDGISAYEEVKKLYI